jgi:uncharacterized damage-inducible protein DinB
LETQTQVETQHKHTKNEIKPITSYRIRSLIRSIQLLEDVNLIEELEISLHDFIKFVQNIPMDKFDYRYAEGKWTIKDIIQHLIDTERIFSYRAMRISRNDKTPLASFDEDDYINNTNANERNLQGLLTEMALVRQSTIALLKVFQKDNYLEWVLSNNPVSVRAIGFTTIAHQHHQKYFKKGIYSYSRSKWTKFLLCFRKTLY